PPKVRIEQCFFHTGDPGGVGSVARPCGARAVRSIIVGVPPVRAVEVISPFDGFVYGFLDRHRLFSLSLLIRSGEDIGSHCETRSYAVRDLREVPCPWSMCRGPPLYGKHHSSHQEAARGAAW